MILDTNFLGALDAGDARGKGAGHGTRIGRLPVRIPTPVVFEVFYGIEGADDPDELLPRYEALFASE